MGAISDSFSTATDNLRHQVDTAVAGGRQFVDLVMTVHPDRWSLMLDLTSRLDAADRLCGEGALLTLEASTQVQRFRRWFADQVKAQALGGAPTPWAYGP